MPSKLQFQIADTYNMCEAEYLRNQIHKRKSPGPLMGNWSWSEIVSHTQIFPTPDMLLEVTIEMKAQEVVN
ncbi:hypothetical protein KC19_VG063100 [Ceratodon purpureus]|uniref:Uncharacterized protein n=1 Tax=Ceratodon purpureus TaxID=3225 RepID=A0A8T0HMI3_CERPU|nr:hypothetical protein KC19_VG063100 [Ceratodon purpureus]